MADAAGLRFSVIEQDGGWFWCSLSLVREDELIGPFPSQQEAEKDAKATLGIKDGGACFSRPVMAGSNLAVAELFRESLPSGRGDLHPDDGEVTRWRVKPRKQD
jgi:hypothetical protein